MAVLDEFLKRSNADGYIYSLQYFDTSTDDMEVVATDKPLPIKLVPSIGSSITLYNAITSVPAAATEIILGNTDAVKIEISGTASARTVTFAAKLTSSSTAVSIDGYNWSTHTLSTSTSGTSTEVWEFDGLAGFYSLIITPTVITGGNLTVKAIKVVA
jgi:hypothetical protein